MSEGFILPSQDVLLDAKNMVDQAHLLRIAFAGTSTQPGLIQRVEGLRPVVENLNQTLDEIRRLSATDAQIGSELGVQLAEISAALKNFAEIVGNTVTDQFSDTFLAEQGQRLLFEVSQNLAKQGGKLAYQDALAEVREQLNEDAKQLLNGKQVQSAISLSAENQALKRELEATKQQLAAARQQLDARGYGYMQNVMISTILGCLAGACIVYMLPSFLA